MARAQRAPLEATLVKRYQKRPPGESSLRRPVPVMWIRPSRLEIDHSQGFHAVLAVVAPCAGLSLFRGVNSW